MASSKSPRVFIGGMCHMDAASDICLGAGLALSTLVAAAIATFTFFASFGLDEDVASATVFFFGLDEDVAFPAGLFFGLDEDVACAAGLFF